MRKGLHNRELLPWLSVNLGHTSIASSWSFGFWPNLKMYKWKWVTYTGSLQAKSSGNRIRVYSGYSGFPGVMISMIERVQIDGHVYCYYCNVLTAGWNADRLTVNRLHWHTVYIVNHTLSHFTSHSAAPNLDLKISGRLTFKFQQGLNLTSKYFERTASIQPSDLYR